MGQSANSVLGLVLCPGQVLGPRGLGEEDRISIHPSSGPRVPAAPEPGPTQRLPAGPLVLSYQETQRAFQNSCLLRKELVPAELLTNFLTDLKLPSVAGSESGEEGAP